MYYVPHTQPGEQSFWNTTTLPLRTPESFEEAYRLLDAAEQVSKRARDEVAQHYGINSRSIFSHLCSINMATSFPYDLMHLIHEDLVPYLIKHWTGEFKGLDSGSGTYRISTTDWVSIGIETAQLNSTIPCAFIGTIPNIEQDQNLLKAEAYAF